jgi:hypothetical protein
MAVEPQDGAHHRRREQDRPFLYFRHDFVLAAIAAEFEGRGVTEGRGVLLLFAREALIRSLHLAALEEVCNDATHK